jgi:hypothetical protein
MMDTIAVIMISEYLTYSVEFSCVLIWLEVNSSM